MEINDGCRVFGERIGSPQRMPYAARFYIVADSREEIDARSEEIISEMAIRDADGHDLLYPNCLGTYYCTEEMHD